MMMERKKCMCIKKVGGTVCFEKGAEYEYDDDYVYSLQKDVEYDKTHYDDEWFKVHFEEITEPRIELKCVGFEEGEPFKHKGYAGTYKIEDGELYTEGSNGWFYAGYMKIIHVLRDIELLPQTTEEDKQIAELKETIEEAMRKIEEIEKTRENTTTTN